MKTGTKFTWGFILAFGGMVLFAIGIALSFSIIGACIGLPMAIVGFPLIIWGSVWLFKARAEKAREIIAKGIQEGLARFELPSATIGPSRSISLPRVAPPHAASIPSFEAAPAERSGPQPPPSQGGLQRTVKKASGEWSPRLAAAVAALAEDVKEGIIVVVRFLSQRKAAPLALAIALVVMTFVAAALGILLYQRSWDREPKIAAAQEDGGRRPNELERPRPERNLSKTAVASPSAAPPARSPSRQAPKPDYRAEAIAQAENLWRQAWIPFGDTWVARAEMSPYLVQIRNRRIEAEAKTLNEADRLNGVEWEGTVAFYRSSERRYAFESSAGGVRMDPYSVGWNEWRSPNAGAIAVYRLKKKDGRWSPLEHDLVTAAMMEWGRDEMVRPKESELRQAGLNVEGAADTPASTPVTSSKFAVTAAATPATSPLPINTAKGPAMLADQSPNPVMQWAGEQFPETRSRFLSPNELQQWTPDRLQYAINEMFARRGAAFGDQRVVRWFQQFPWYRPNSNLSFDQIEAGMPEIERDNLKLLGDVRDAKRASAPTASTSVRTSKPPRGDSNFPHDRIGQVIGRFFQSVGDNAKQGPRRSPTPTKKRTR